MMQYASVLSVRILVSMARKVVMNSSRWVMSAGAAFENYVSHLVMVHFSNCCTDCL